MARLKVLEIDFNNAHKIEKAPIPRKIIDKLKTHIATPPKCRNFRCVICGKTRTDPTIIDPGVLHSQRTCAQAQKSCDDEDLNLKLCPLQFWPGSLVVAEVTPKMYWPAIVEYSTDEIGGYILRQGANREPYAYYITFIGVDPDCSYGGWFYARNLRSLQVTTVSFANAPNQLLRRALRLCYSYLYSGSLRRRLLELSYIFATLRATEPELSSLPAPTNDNTPSECHPNSDCAAIQPKTHG